MLTEDCVEALLVDEELADLVWKAWDAGVISDEIAADVWSTIGSPGCTT
jgi:hypothetical protein